MYQKIISFAGHDGILFASIIACAPWIIFMLTPAIATFCISLISSATYFAVGLMTAALCKKCSKKPAS